MPGSYRKYNRDNSVTAVSERKKSFGDLQQQCCLYGQGKSGCQGVTEVKIILPLLAARVSWLTDSWVTLASILQGQDQQALLYFLGPAVQVDGLIQNPKHIQKVHFP